MIIGHTSAIARRRIIIVFGVGVLALAGLAAVSPLVVAKEKYAIDPVTGTKYKPEPEMKELLVARAALGGKPIETLTPTEARLQPTLADAVNAVLKSRGLDSDPTKIVPNVTTTDATITTEAGTEITATV